MNIKVYSIEPYNITVLYSNITVYHNITELYKSKVHCHTILQCSIVPYNSTVQYSTVQKENMENSIVKKTSHCITVPYNL